MKRSLKIGTYYWLLLILIVLELISYWACASLMGCPHPPPNLCWSLLLLILPNISPNFLPYIN